MRHEDIVKKWNEAADEFNQWDNLGGEEQIEFAFVLGRESGIKKDDLLSCPLCGGPATIGGLSA